MLPGQRDLDPSDYASPFTNFEQDGQPYVRCNKCRGVGRPRWAHRCSIGNLGNWGGFGNWYESVDELEKRRPNKPHSLTVERVKELLAAAESSPLVFAASAMTLRPSELIALCRTYLDYGDCGACGRKAPLVGGECPDCRH